jgi:hypothetical protein
VFSKFCLSPRKLFGQLRPTTSAKKTDVADHPGVIDHVGLLVNEPSGPCRFALYLVIRKLQYRLNLSAANLASGFCSDLHPTVRPGEYKVRLFVLFRNHFEEQIEHSHFDG